MSRYARKVVVQLVEDQTKVIDGLDFSDSDVTAEYIRKMTGNAMNEQFVVLAFSLAKEYVGEGVLNSGLIDQVQVDVPGLLRLCLLSGGTRFIIGHNHPGGGVSPSREDILLTTAVNGMFNVMMFEMLDHIIVNQDEGTYYSFRRDFCTHSF